MTLCEGKKSPKKRKFSFQSRLNPMKSFFRGGGGSYFLLFLKSSYFLFWEKNGNPVACGLHWLLIAAMARK